MNNEYDSLINSGYTEEELNLGDITSVSKVGVSEFPMGPGRVDRATQLTDAQGAHIKSSSIMMGYNKAGIKFPNGDYISAQEFEAALTTAIESIPREKIIVCKKTGKIVKNTELFRSILDLTKDAASISLGESSPAIKNQETATLSIKGEKLKETIKKGVLMLGNGKIQMPGGEYLSLEEVETAIREHVLMSKEDDEVIVVPPATTLIPKQPEVEPQKRTTRKVVKRKKTKWNLWPIILAILMTLAMGFKITPKQPAKYDTLTTEQLNYIVSYLEEHREYKSEEEMISELIYELDTGETVNIPEGVKYYSASDSPLYEPNNYSVFGQGQREAGEYDVDYISIIYDGQIVKVERQKGVSVGETIENYCKQNNVDSSDLTIMLHLGGPVAGWVDINDIISNTNFKPEVSSVTLEEKEEYKGVEENFEGKIIIEVDGKSVEINLLDENGNLVTEDSIVVGSDGQQYRVSKLNKEEITKTVETSPATKTKISWSVHNITKEEALFTAAVGLAGTLALKKKKEAITEVTEEEYEQMLEQFAADHKDDLTFDADSKFLQIINKINTKQPNWKAMSINLEIPNAKLEVVDDRISKMYEVDEKGRRI